MIKVVSCFWNAEQYITNCLKTLKNQIDKDFEVYLIDDMSNDKSVSIIKSLILDDDRFKLIVNTEKKFKLKNLDELISTFNDDDIIVELDGDDFLLGNEVIGDIRKMYNNKNTWLTNGSFMYSNGLSGFSSKVDANNIRSSVFTFSHLRTWKSFLWKSIPKDYFKDEDGTYFKSAADVAYTMPLLELSGEEHYVFNPKILYVYNGNSQYNDHKDGSASGGGLTEQSRCVNIIRNKQKLNKLIK